MPYSSSSSRLAQSSPSISLEKGAYRLRAPRTRTTSQLQLQPLQVYSRPPEVSSSSSLYQKQMVVLVIFLVFATLSCFGTAYYLFTTRWDAGALSSFGNASDDFPDARAPPTVVHFNFDSEPGSDSSLSHSSPLSSLSPRSSSSSVLSLSLSNDNPEEYLAYLPHSGFHNQRIAFENALVLARLLNRTLLVPPVRLGSKPIHYLPFDELRATLDNATKAGLEHCRVISLDVQVDEEVEAAPECVDYDSYTYVPWDWLVDLSTIKAEQRLLFGWNLTDSRLFERLGISVETGDIVYLKDTSRNQYSFLDFKSSTRGSFSGMAPLTLSRKYLESVQIVDLALIKARLLFVGTLMGSSRLHLRESTNYQLRKHIRERMTFANPVLTELVERVRDALGGQYLGAHVRLGDGLFRENAERNARLVWWKIVHEVLGLGVRDALEVERQLVVRDNRSNGGGGEYDGDDGDDEVWIRQPPRIPLDIPNTLRVPHPPLPPLDVMNNTKLAYPCTRPRHTASELAILNTPLFISSDVSRPREDAVLSRFTRTFPCTFFLDDFGEIISALEGLESGFDGVKLKPFLIPFLDAMIAARSWAVVGTEGSTFSTFVVDVLWRREMGFEIVQRG